VPEKEKSHSDSRFERESGAGEWCSGFHNGVVSPEWKKNPSVSRFERGRGQDVVGAGKEKVPLRLAFRARERGRGVVVVAGMAWGGI
jgi:hypothetical protein